MTVYLDCIPCILRQSLDATRFATSDSDIQARILRETLQAVGQLDWRQPPAASAQRLHRRIRELTGLDDPYREVKQQQNDAAIEYIERLRAEIRQSPIPLELAVRLAIAGNIIDLAVKTALESSAIHENIADAVHLPLDGDVDHFAASVAAAERILYLTDNAGEIVFDRLLIEHLPLHKVTVAVRGRPVINDATRADAEAAGIAEFVPVIDNGSDAPGTILEDCSECFRHHFEAADLIISKGQGNHETLLTSSRPIYFLLRVKCDVIARNLACAVGTMVLRPSGALC
jgi:uncharacterized protein with ATP-grasp and redox domains